MTTELSVPQAEKNLERLESDLQTRLDDLDTRIQTAEEKKFYGIVLQLEAQRNVLENAYSGALERAREAVNQARRNLDETNQAVESRRLAVENEMKENMRRVWLRHGGDPGAFELAWPELRTEELSRRVLDSVRERQQDRRHPKL